MNWKQTGNTPTGSNTPSPRASLKRKKKKTSRAKLLWAGTGPRHTHSSVRGVREGDEAHGQQACDCEKCLIRELFSALCEAASSHIYK